LLDLTETNAMLQKTITEQDNPPVEVAAPTANPPRLQATRPFGDRSGQALPLQLSQSPITDHRSPFRSRLRTGAFTLAELVVTVGVLVVLVLLFTQLLKSAATVTTLGHKQMDADSQARQLLDRMAIDFAQLVKRSDVDFFAKGTVAPNSVGGAMTGNDQIAFYSAVPGYYPQLGSQSPVSLVAYRVNSLSGATAFNKLGRLGTGLVWNGVSTTDIPVVFMPLTIAAIWPAATSSSLADPNGNYEIIGPQVFRFEYCYLLRSNGSLSITPPSDISQIAAIVADIAVIDSKSKVLLDDTQITLLAGQLGDYALGMVPGQLRNNWQNALNANTTLPRPALSGVRLYERFFYLSPPTL
jgi:hypothetical protein